VRGRHTRPKRPQRQSWWAAGWVGRGRGAHPDELPAHGGSVSGQRSKGVGDSAQPRRGAPSTVGGTRAPSGTSFVGCLFVCLGLSWCAPSRGATSETEANRERKEGFGCSPTYHAVKNVGDRPATHAPPTPLSTHPTSAALAAGPPASVRRSPSPPTTVCTTGSASADTQRTCRPAAHPPVAQRKPVQENVGLGSRYLHRLHDEPSVSQQLPIIKPALPPR